jgi:branched-subunit amino acid aminotransferase/4-amino-4-deoxychorismate lyase
VTRAPDARPRREAPPPFVPDRALWVNGTMLRAEEAALSLFDRGARDGEGLFETIRIANGRCVAWKRHLERMVLAAAELGFPVPPAPDVLAQAVSETLEANGLASADAAARITVTRGIAGRRPTRAGCWIDVEPLAERLWPGTRNGDASAIVATTPHVPSPLCRYKTTSRLAYLLAREEARAAGADEALLVSASNELLEGAVSNVFVVLGEDVITPSLDRGVLPGVTRRRVIEACESIGIRVRESTLPIALARAADEMFLTNALQGVVPIAMLDDRPYALDVTARRVAAALTEM